MMLTLYHFLFPGEKSPGLIEARLSVQLKAPS